MEKKKTNVIAIVTMFFLFAMIAFVTNLAAPVGNIWKQSYSWAGMWGNMMNFLAYLFMGIPAGKMLQTKGYKKTALVALALGAIGIFVQWLSSKVGADVAVFKVGGDVVALNFIIYLLGAFICGFCVCMLNTVVNPMLTILGGGGNKGNQLVQAGGSLNSLAGTLTPLFVGALIGTVSNDTKMADVVPLLYIALAVFVVSFLIILFVNIPEPALGAKKESYSHSPWNFRHTVLGVAAIFCYVGVEVGIPGTLNFYISDPTAKGAGLLLNGAAVGGALAAMYWLLMLVGRLSSTAISGKVSPKAQLVTTTSVAMLFLLLAIILPKTTQISMPGFDIHKGFMMVQVPISALFLVLCGLCTSVMWGCIFSLAVNGLGKYTEQASGIFMMMVVGGGVIPLVQDALSKSVGYINSYWLLFILVGYMLFYALIGSKNVNKDIPVD